MKTLLPTSLLLTSLTASAAVTMKVENREFSGRPRDIIVMENDRVLVEIVPSDAGRIVTYMDKTLPITGFEWLDDCPYHYACRWEGQEFAYTLGENTPDKVSATVKGGGKIAVGYLKSLTGISVANPVEIEIERTMTLEKNASRLRIDVKITNVGEGIAPKFRYMMHGVWGSASNRAMNLPREPFAFILPTENGTEFFDSKRGHAVFGSNYRGDPKHPFHRFTPGVLADKPRFEPKGWVALLTAGGPNYVEYDTAQFDFFQYWYGGDGAWHWTSEPHTRPVNLEPGQSLEFWFALACDAADVNFATPTVAYGSVTAPVEAAPDAEIAFSVGTTTARNVSETATVTFAVKKPDGSDFASKTETTAVKGFKFEDLKTAFKLPDDAPLGHYEWTATIGDGSVIDRGKFEVMTREEASRRASERAVAEAKAALEAKIADLAQKEANLTRETRLWRPAANLLVNLRNPAAWQSPSGATPAFRVIDNATPVFGHWQSTEAIRVKAYRPVATAFPQNFDQRFAVLAKESDLLTTVAASPDGKHFAALLANAQIVVITPDGNQKRFGLYAEKPTEEGDQLGKNTRAIAVDNDGNVWVATTVWGNTSKYVAGPDGQPSEQSVPGYKGAIKIFAANGTFKSSTAVLDTPTDIVPAIADGIPVMLVPYRNVSAYHGAMVREGVALLDAKTGARLGELKTPTGSIAIDGNGGIWVSDVAGHISRHTPGGKKLSGLAETSAPAVADAVLPELAPLPMILRTASDGSIWALRPMQRELLHITEKAGLTSVTRAAIPADPGRLVTLLLDGDTPVVIGQKGVHK